MTRITPAVERGTARAVVWLARQVEVVLAHHVELTLVSEPAVPVLDEATANLDLQTEAQVDRALDAVPSGRTAIVIAHRCPRP